MKYTSYDYVPKLFTKILQEHKVSEGVFDGPQFNNCDMDIK